MKFPDLRKTGAAALASPLVLLAALLTGCDDDKGSAGSLTGSFIDSAVQGLRYQAEPSGLRGLTNTAGEFRYRAGDTVTFYIGDLPLGAVTGAETITPVDVALAEYESAGDRDNFTLNVIRLLQTLDSDGNPDNGITITPATQAFFTSTNATAEVLADIADSLADTAETFEDNAALVAVFDDADIDALVDAEAAQFHFTKTAMRGFWLRQDGARGFLLGITEDLQFINFDDTNCGTGYEAQGDQAFDEYTTGDCREGADFGQIDFDTGTGILLTGPCEDCEGFVTDDSTGSSGLLDTGEGFGSDPVEGWIEFIATASTFTGYAYENHDEDDGTTPPQNCGEECISVFTRVTDNGSNPAFGLWQVEGEASFVALLNTVEGDIQYYIASFGVTPTMVSENDEDNGVEHGYLDCDFTGNSCDLSVNYLVFDGNGTAGLSSLPEGTHTLEFIPGASRALDTLEITVAGEGTTTLVRML